MKGIDFSYGKIKGSVIRDAGFDFVMRYLSNSPGKNLTKDEYIDLKSADLAVGCVWETTTSRPLDGFDAGVQDAKSALSQIQSITGSSQVIYFAVDAEYNDTQLDKIGDYFDGVASILVKHQIGVYGGFATVGYMFDNNLVAYGWQTYAWSHGQWDNRVQLRQTDIYGPKLAGVECDTNEQVNDDAGLF